MKKVLFVLAVAAVMVSCGNKKKSDKPAEVKDTISTTTTTTTTTTTSEVPKFSDPEVQQWVNDYTAFVTAYVDAYKGKDMTKVAELSQKMSDWSSKSMTIVQKLAAHPEEATAFSNYLAKLSQELTAAMQMK